MAKLRHLSSPQNQEQFKIMQGQRELCCFLYAYEMDFRKVSIHGSGGGIRTPDQPVNSRLLYR